VSYGRGIFQGLVQWRLNLWCNGWYISPMVCPSFNNEWEYIHVIIHLVTYNTWESQVFISSHRDVVNGVSVSSSVGNLRGL